MPILAILSNPAALERGFTLCAIVGGILLLLRMVLLLIGGELSDSSVEDVGHTDMDFRFLSLQGIMAFLLIFGLTGRAFLLETQLGTTVAFFAALVAGSLAMWAMAGLFFLMRRLQDSGNMDLNKAIGQQGTIYLTVPEGGTGEAQVVFAGKMQIHDAISEDSRAIETGARIVVVGVTGTSTLVVRREAARQGP